jgi:hypothetical protein
MPISIMEEAKTAPSIILQRPFTLQHEGYVDAPDSPNMNFVEITLSFDGRRYFIEDLCKNMSRMEKTVGISTLKKVVMNVDRTGISVKRCRSVIIWQPLPKSSYRFDHNKELMTAAPKEQR